MSCTEIEKQIILFSELTQKEQAIVNNHVQKCEACAKFYESQVSVNNLIGKGAGIQPEPRDPSRLTHNIMAAIKVQEQRRTKIFDLDSFPVPYSFARYGMAAISVGLLILFGTELLATNRFEQTAMRSVIESIVLNRRDFQEKLFHTKSMSNFSLASQCSSPFNIIKINEDCLRQRMSLK